MFAQARFPSNYLKRTQKRTAMVSETTSLYLFFFFPLTIIARVFVQDLQGI